MQVVTTINELREARQALKGRVGLVPTMGYLHKGHLSLVQAAKEDCTAVIATIFVNPTQFAANEDLSSYPRDLPRDLDFLRDAGVNLVFTPTPDIIYPKGYQTYIEVEKASQGRESASRPTHFRGVATVVAKLFNIAQADRAYFGQKDAQQVVVIRQMARDLNFLTQIHVCPIVREGDKLAMSSRNVYLTPEERAIAPILNQALRATGDLYGSGERDPHALRQKALEVLATQPLAQTDYVSVALAKNLQEIETPSSEALLLSLAVKIGKPRLLDNCILPLGLNTRKGATAVLGIEG
jgi:pantoate--beta-alanine ligase